MTSNFLLLNSEKKQVLIIGPKTPTSNNLVHCLTLDGCSVDSSSSVRNLGVLFDSNLSFNSHVSTVQNAAARVLTRTRKYDHFSPVLSTLHWLPIKHGIDFKIMSITYKTLNGLAPQYLSELVSHYSPPRPMCYQNI